VLPNVNEDLLYIILSYMLLDFSSSRDKQTKVAHDGYDFPDTR